MLVQGVEGDKGGLGYFGFSYYEQNQDKLNLVAVDDGDGCVKPEHRDDPGRHVHAALAAAVHVPERRRRSAKPEVKGFMEYVVDNATEHRRGGADRPARRAAGSRREVRVRGGPRRLGPG